MAGYREMVKGYRSRHGVRIAMREDRTVLNELLIISSMRGVGGGWRGIGRW